MIMDNYPDYERMGYRLQDRHVVVAQMALRETQRELDIRGTTKQFPIPTTVARKAIELAPDEFTGLDPRAVEAAAEIAIIEVKSNQNHNLTPEL